MLQLTTHYPAAEGTEGGPVPPQPAVSCSSATPAIPTSLKSLWIDLGRPCMTLHVLTYKQWKLIDCSMWKGNLMKGQWGAHRIIGRLKTQIRKWTGTTGAPGAGCHCPEVLVALLSALSLIPGSASTGEAQPLSNISVSRGFPPPTSSKGKRDGCLTAPPNSNTPTYGLSPVRLNIKPCSKGPQIKGGTP